MTISARCVISIERLSEERKPTSSSGIGSSGIGFSGIDSAGIGDQAPDSARMRQESESLVA